MTWEERNIFGSTVYETDNKQIIRNNIDKLNSVICFLCILEVRWPYVSWV